MKKTNLLLSLLFLLPHISMGVFANPGELPVMIRPFGDSITFGYSDDFSATFNNCYNSQIWCLYPGVEYDGYFGGGYRGVLTWLAINKKEPIIKHFGTVGNQSGGSSIKQWLSMSQIHDGYPGARTDQMVPYSLMPTPLVPPIPTIPTITLIHLGTNDIAQGFSSKLNEEDIVNRASNNLSTIIENILNHNMTHVYVAKIIRFAKPKPGCTFAGKKCMDYSSANKIVDKYNTRIGEKFANLKGVTVVDMSNLLSNDDYSADGVHPELSGYFLISCKWSEAANLFLSEKTCNNISLEELKTLNPLAQVPR